MLTGKKLPNHLTPDIHTVGTAEAVPQAERYGRQLKAAVTATALGNGAIAVGVGEEARSYLENSIS